MPKVRPLPRHTLARNLRLLMEIHQMTGRELALKAKVDPKTVNNQIHGRYEPGAEKADAVASVFGLEGWQLLDPRFDPVQAANKKLQGLLAHYSEADEEGKENILRVAEMAAKYKRR